MKATIMDCRECGYCTRGVRLFCKKHDIDFMNFLRNGIDLAILDEINDSMANKVAEAARGRK